MVIVTLKLMRRGVSRLAVTACKIRVPVGDEFVSGCHPADEARQDPKA